MCFRKEQWMVACMGPRHWLVQPPYLLLKEQLGSALLNAQWTDK